MVSPCVSRESSAASATSISSPCTLTCVFGSRRKFMSCALRLAAVMSTAGGRVPFATASKIAFAADLVARSWSTAPRQMMSAPASKEATAACIGICPEVSKIAPMSRASVTTTPSNPRSPRNRSVVIARDKLAGASASMAATKRCPVITEPTPAPIADLNGRSSRARRISTVEERVGRVAWLSICVSP